jgi:peptidoglycan hydrolase CwlO-like protein
LELSRLEGSQEASSEAHNLLKEENARLRTLLEEGEAQLGVLRSDVAALQQKVEKLQAEKTMIEGQFKSVVTERDQALAEVAGLRSEATALAHDR